MSLAEEIKRTLMENPSILVEVLTARPEIIYQALARLTPWQNLATKDDIKRIEEKMVTKEEFRALDERARTLDERVKTIESKVNTLDERVTSVEERVKKVEARVNEIEERVNEIDQKVSALDQKVSTLDERVKSLEERVKTVEEKMATKQELEEIRKVMATKDDLKKLEERVKAIEEQMATKDDLKRFKVLLDGIGARWGMMSEEAFREGVAEILKDVGWEVKREIEFDKEGIVYGEPSDVEIDVVIKDGKVIIVEITHTLKRSDLDVIARKRQFYEKARGRKVDEVVVVTPFIHDKNPERVIAAASLRGIRVLKPQEM
ncbi:MAG: DUF3782 domain-containing protein [Thermoprotei archaeon]